MLFFEKKRDKIETEHETENSTQTFMREGTSRTTMRLPQGVMGAIYTTIVFALLGKDSIYAWMRRVGRTLNNRPTPPTLPPPPSCTRPIARPTRHMLS